MKVVASNSWETTRGERLGTGSGSEYRNVEVAGS